MLIKSDSKILAMECGGKTNTALYIWLNKACTALFIVCNIVWDVLFVRFTTKSYEVTIQP